MDRSTPWPVVKLSPRPEIQISANISWRTSKTSLVCIKIKIGKNGLFPRQMDQTNHAFPIPQARAKGQGVPGP